MRLESQVVLEEPFRLDQVSETKAPDGTAAVWFRYVISQGPNTIVGLRPGPRTDAMSQLEEMVARLNDRRMGKKHK
jgi:hypothetical protein